MNVSTQTDGANELGEERFDQEVLASDVPVLVDFGAEWCPPCRALAPTIDALASEYAERAKVVKVDVDASPRLAATYGIQSIPTVLVFKAGQVVRRFVGLTGMAELRGALDRAG